MKRKYVGKAMAILLTAAVMMTETLVPVAGAEFGDGVRMAVEEEAEAVAEMEKSAEIEELEGNDELPAAEEADGIFLDEEEAPEMEAPEFTAEALEIEDVEVFSAGEDATYYINQGRVVIDAQNGGRYKIEGTGVATYNTITVKVSSVNTFCTVTINNVNINGYNNFAFLIEGPGTVNLILENDNQLKSSFQLAALALWYDANLKIGGEGSLYAYGTDGAGIGNMSASGASGGSITIEGGNIYAESKNGVGIGGMGDTLHDNIGVTGIVINGGNVKASGNPGIGGGKRDYDITINGGNVTASGGIGGDSSNVNFSTGRNGNAVINTDRFTENTTINKSELKGIIFEDATGKVYGNPFELSQNCTIPEGKTLEIPQGYTLTIPNGVTLSVPQNGTITNSGNITGNGTLKIDGSYVAQGSGTIADAVTKKGTFYKAAPEPPIISSEETDGTTVKLTSENSNTNILKYGYQTGNEQTPSYWQSGGIFTGLIPAAKYVFYTKYTYSDVGDKVSTSGLTVYTAPNTPKKVSFTDKEIVIKSEIGLEYTVYNEGDLEKPVDLTEVTGGGNISFRGVNPNTTYYIYSCVNSQETENVVRKKSEPLIVTTKKSAPAAPTVAGYYTANASRTGFDYMITNPIGTTYEYKMDEYTTTWQTGNEFKNIIPGTTHKFYARVKETTDTVAGTEGSVEVQFNKLQGSGTVTMGSWNVGQSAKEPVPNSKTNGINHVTYSYIKLPNGEYVSQKPSEAGNYKVKATFAETAVYSQCEAEADFTISENPNQIAVDNAVNVINQESGWQYTQAQASDKNQLQSCLKEKVNTLLTEKGYSGIEVNITFEGTPTMAVKGTQENRQGTNGSFSFKVKLTKDGEPKGEKSTEVISGTITATRFTAPVYTGNTFDSCTYHEAADLTLTANTDSTFSHSWKVSEGELPPGLSLNETGGKITGTPTAAGTYTATVTVTNSNNESDSAAVAITVNQAEELVIDFPAASGITYGQKLSDSTLSGGSTTYGSFAWTNKELVPTVMNNGYEVTFTPNEDAVNNYKTITPIKKDISVTVEKVTPAVNLETIPSWNGTTCSAVLTATVTKVGGGEIPSGTVTFKQVNGSKEENISTAVNVNAEGKAVYTWDSLSQQEYTVKAYYSGSTNYMPSEATDEFDTTKQAQLAFTLEPTGKKTYGDAPFTLTTSGGSGSGAVTFTCSDSSVVSIEGNQATVKKAGTATITATKAEDSTYNQAAASVTVTVDRKSLTITADDKSVTRGGKMPEFTYTADGFVNGDTFTKPPTLAAAAQNTNTTGKFDITVEGGSISGGNENYSIVYTKGILTIKAPPAVITPTPSPSPTPGPSPIPENYPEGTVATPDGNLETPNGTVIESDGTIRLPSGTVLEADGNGEKPLMNKDGTVTVKDGNEVTLPTGDKVTPPEASIVTPDGTITEPDGTVIKPDATVHNTDYSVQRLDGSYITPAKPIVESTEVFATGNRVRTELFDECAGAEGYDYVISENINCIKDKDYLQISKNQLLTDTSFYYIQKGTYYVYCHAWKKDENGIKKFSKWSEPKLVTVTATTPEQPEVTDVKVRGSRVTVTYTKCQDATGYDVVLGTLYRKVSGEYRPLNYGKNVKKVGRNTYTVTFTNVDSGKYYVGLHSYNRTSEDGRKVFSPWSGFYKIRLK